jgi:hypothetical protein
MEGEKNRRMTPFLCGSPHLGRRLALGQKPHKNTHKIRCYRYLFAFNGEICVFISHDTGNRRSQTA